MTRRLLACTAIAALAGASLVGCSSSSDASACPDVNAAFASYDPYVGGPQRIMVGLLCGDGLVIAGGTVQTAFSYGGTAAKPITPTQPGPTATAAFLSIPGRGTSTVPTKPTASRPSVANGVYGTSVTLDKAGLWDVRVTGKVSGSPIDVTTTFTVNSAPQVIAVGQSAPATANPVAGTPDVAANTIDSRATDGAPIPDPELHSISIADALAQKKPLMVVVSTPVYCTSQFCGPITDEVQKLAARYGSQMAFVHLEIWADFTNNRTNEFALQWIAPKNGTDPREPWVFVIGRDGTVIERFDNVATTAELEAAVTRAIA